MRITVALITLACVTASAVGHSQGVTLSLKKAPLEKVFAAIEKQGYYFTYTRELLQGTDMVDVNVKNASINHVMDICVKDQPISYEIIDRAIIIKKRIPTVSDYSSFNNLPPPPIDIRGRVINEKGEAVAASIIVKGTTRGTSTNEYGEFELIGVDNNATLVISGVSIKTFEVRVNGRTELVLKANTKTVIEQGVTINKGYYSTTQRMNTGNVSTIKASDLETQPVTNVLAAMQGRMAGVFITQTTGAPGGGFDIKIRGQNSLRRDANAPLYIIDGVPFSSETIGYAQTSTPFPYPFISSPLNSINPDDIESIEVLKDADATAIYGSRGANGVVLITTKMGKKGKTTFNVSGSAGWGKVTRFLPLMNTQEYIAMRKQAFINDGRTQWDPWDYDMNGTWDTTRYTDWQKELQGGTTHINDVQGSVSGGSDNTQFMLSSSYHQESTVYPGDFKYKRGGAHLSLNHSSTDRRFRLVFGGGYNIQNNNLPAFDISFDARFTPPNAPALYNPDGSLNWENGTWTNPLAQLKAEHRSKTNNLIANTMLSYEIIKNLTLKSNFGFSNLGIVESRSAPSTTTNPVFNRPPSRSSIMFNNTSRSSWIIEPQINFEKVMAKSRIDILVGATAQSQLTKTMYQTGFGFSSNSLLYNLAAAQFISIEKNDNTQYNYQAFFGRLSYNMLDRYIINLTARRDGSSRFGPGKQFANFGAVGAGWIFSDEHFLEDSRWLSFGKIRASYGTTGNDQIGDYQYFNTYNPSGSIYAGINGLQPTRLFNPDFAWEINKKLELGLEFGLFNDRIFTTVSWYRNRSSNQLVGIPLPGTTGFSVLEANLEAEVENKGLEVTLRTVNFSKTELKWATNLNISFSRNKLLSFPGLESSTYRNKYRVGQPLNISLLYQYTGINQQSGVYEFEDFDKDGNISFAEDARVITDLNPKFYGGLQNQLTYKKWNLDFLFQFVKQKTLIYVMGPAGTMANQLNIMSDSWTKPGDKTDHQIGTTGYNFDAYIADYNFQYSDATITDGSFIRLKNIALSYELPLGRDMKSCKIMVEAQNLLTVTSYKYGDPEYGYVGYLPPLKVVTAGIRLSF